ncbi:MAG: diguanylate cyclase [Nitrospirae bacterium]|nr:diguanylate cyclase [Nitrospirota bacterium]
MSKPPGSLNLVRKLVLASIIVGLLPMILGFSLTYVSQRGAIQKTMGSAFQVLAHETGAKLSLLVNDLLDKAIELARSDALVRAAGEADRKYQGLGPEAVRERVERAAAHWKSSKDSERMDRPAVDMLEEFRQRNPAQYHLLVLTDREGAVVAASPRRAATRYLYRDEIEWEAAFDEGRGKLFIGDTTWDPELSAYTLNVAIPVRRNGEIFGVLILNHTVDRLFKSVTDVHIGHSDHTMLAASDGSLLFCPIFQIKNHTLSKGFSQAIFRENDGWTTTQVDVHYPGREAINGFAPVNFKIEDFSPKSLGGQRWYIFTSQNPEETYAPLRSLLHWTAFSAGIGSVILIVLAVLVVRTIVRPITLLRTQARDIIQGIQSLPMERRTTATPYVLPKIDIHTGDEIEDLAGTFYEMTGVLERTRRFLVETTHRLEEMAIRDELTGLYNRRHVLEELKTEFSRSVRFSLPLSCMEIDLDFFKDVNDRYGHQVGDRILRQISELFQKGFREPDILARIGGEEFLVILPQTDVQGALAKAERLREQVTQHVFTIDYGRTIRLTISIGVAVYPDERIQNIDHLVKIADDALYQSKRDGRNRVSRG